MKKNMAEEDGKAVVHVMHNTVTAILTDLMRRDQIGRGEEAEAHTRGKDTEVRPGNVSFTK